MSQRISVEDRAVARVWLFVRDGQVERKKFDRALKTVPGAVEQKAGVEERLRHLGVHVVEPALPTTGGGGQAVVGETDLARSARIPTPRRSRTVKLAGPAVEAARAVLEYDRRYPRRAGRVLTAEEEVGLTTLLRAGCDFSEPLPKRYRKQLADGSEPALAFDAMVIHNVRLVYSTAKGFVPRIEPSGNAVEFEDLAQAGMVGLIRAIEMFDASRGNKFSTYATNWIRQSISREMDDTARTIRLPVHVMEQMRVIWAAIDRLQANSQPAHPGAISEITGMEEEKVARYLDYLRTPASLDLMVGDDESTQLHTFMPAPYEASPEYACLAWHDANELAAALDSLDTRSARILRLRSGLEGGVPRTLDDIGTIYGVTRERIRQLESKALKELREGPFGARLRPMLGNVHVVWDEESGFASDTPVDV